MVKVWPLSSNLTSDLVSKASFAVLRDIHNHNIVGGAEYIGRSLSLVPVRHPPLLNETRVIHCSGYSMGNNRTILFMQEWPCLTSQGVSASSLKFNDAVIYNRDASILPVSTIIQARIPETLQQHPTVLEPVFPKLISHMAERLEKG